jgi:AraC-like DNA-binding protein
MGTPYRERSPHAALAGPVVCVWTREAGQAPQRIVPDGCVDLVWIDGRLEMVGPDTGPWLAQAAPGSGVAGIRVRPGSARLLLGEIPASALRDQQVDLADLWGFQARPLTNRLAATTDHHEAARLLERATLARLRGFDRDAAVDSAVSMLHRTNPPPVPIVAETLGLSERQLRRRITAAVGYGPKTLETILRFRRATRLGVGPGGLAELANATGYADQAHLTREVRRLVGMPPRAWFSRTPAGCAGLRW